MLEISNCVLSKGARRVGQEYASTAVVLAMGPWTGRLAGVELPAVRGLKGYSVTLAAADVPPHALFVDYRTAEDPTVLAPNRN